MTQPTTKSTGSEDLMEASEQGPTRDQIAALAYALWQERGGPDGSPEEDWLNAEQELRTRTGLAHSPSQFDMDAALNTWR